MIAESPWPTYDESKMIDETVNIAVQINGKLRGTMNVPNNTREEELIRLSKELENVQKYISEK